jgi:hypothetical protein
MVGDILDVLHSTRWLEKGPDTPGYVRPWTDFHSSDYAAKISDIIRAILANNQESITILKKLTQVGFTLQSVTVSDKVDQEIIEIQVKVYLYYMIGSHDWYYHLPGPTFDKIRVEIVDAFGLSNSPGPFPYELKESTELSTLLNRYNVVARHGDRYDLFNYALEKGRHAFSLGDAFAVEILVPVPA